jgi:hypothetical protein
MPVMMHDSNKRMAHSHACKYGNGEIHIKERDPHQTRCVRNSYQETSVMF